MSIIKFRQLHKCQNGHENYLYFELCGSKLYNFKWGEPMCDCPKFALGEGYSPCGDAEIYEGDVAISNKEIPLKPYDIYFEGEETKACPTCDNWSIGQCKYCPDCGQRLDQKYKTHDDYSGV